MGSQVSGPGLSGCWRTVLTTATNIIITLQTLRSVVAGSEEANVHQRCTIAAEMLDAFASVPVSYIQAGSAPMVSSSRY